MIYNETEALVRIAAAAHDRTAPDGTVDIWYATLADLPFGLARQAIVELLQTSPYWPKPADIRERARLIDAQARRERAKRAQLDARQQRAIEAPAAAKRARTGADMVRHVLGRLADAGQDVAAGKLLGADRARDIAGAAVAEWLDRTQAPPAPPPYTGGQTACPGCHLPHEQPPGTLCGICAPQPTEAFR
jgi:hypothetical protein